MVSGDKDLKFNGLQNRFELSPLVWENTHINKKYSSAKANVARLAAILVASSLCRLGFLRQPNTRKGSAGIVGFCDPTQSLLLHQPRNEYF